jgi:hypothetical protein
MPSYRVVAMQAEVAERIRTTRTSPFGGHPTHVEVATGHGPCRHCLRTFAIGVERRILASYDPFRGREPFPLPGPVFIHEAACERYDESSGFPADLRAHGLTLNAYGPGRILRAEQRVEPGDAEAAIARLLERPDVAYLHVRDTAAGCFDFEVRPVRDD